MIGSVERYSSTTGKRRASLARGRVLRVLVLALVLYLVLSRFVGSTFRVESHSMEPGLMPTDRIVVSLLAYGPRVPFATTRLPGLGRPQRGDIVVVQPPFLREPTVVSRIIEPLVRFFTLQKVTVHRDLYGAGVTGSMVKRIIALPGDTIRMVGYVLSVRPRGGTDFIPEQQLLGVRYTLKADVGAPGWTSDLPLSGNAAEITLKDNEYYVLGDNRPQSSDSRSWGPVTIDRIMGRVVYRYWPPRSIGTP
jgi:signal peptidase I